MKLYEFTFQHPNVAEVMWDYQDCADENEAQKYATNRSKDLKFKLIKIKEVILWVLDHKDSQM